MHKKIVISIIMPLYNAEKFIDAAVNSLLKQTYHNFELIIINDTSNDSSIKKINKYQDKRIKIITNKQRLGVTKSLNIGIKHANGEFIARMDADDISELKRLEWQLNYLKKNSQVMLLGGWASGAPKMPLTHKEIKKNFIKYNCFIHPTIIFRKKIIKSVGTYNENFDGAEDYDLFLRIAQKFPVANVPKMLIKYRRHPNSVTIKKLKKTELQAIKVRVNALLYYNYPKWQVIYLIKPLLSFLIPASLKLRLLYINEK